MNGRLRFLAIMLLRWSATLLPASRSQWAKAMFAELEAIEDDRFALDYALGCLWASTKECIVTLNFAARVVRIAVPRDDADVLRLHVKGDDFSDVFVAGLLEGSDGGHVISPCDFDPAPVAVSMAIVRTGTIRRCSPWPAAHAEDAGDGLSWTRQGRPARNGRQPRGRKSEPGVAAEAVEALADPGQISPSRGHDGRG